MKGSPKLGSRVSSGSKKRYPDSLLTASFIFNVDQTPHRASVLMRN